MVYGIARGLPQAALGRAPALSPTQLGAQQEGLRIAGRAKQRITLLYRGGAPWSPETFHDKMVYGLDKMVYALPWLDKTAIKRSCDKMVYGLPSLDKTAIGLDKVVYGR